MRPEKIAVSDIILDASALLAYVLDEPGKDVVEEVLQSAVVSANNIAEVSNVLLGRHVSEDGVRESIDGLDLRIAPVDSDLAVEIGFMVRRYRKLGLSLGDCSCISLARKLDLPVLTGDRVWAELPGLGIDVRLFR